jgi:hypothetical protein
MLALIGADCSNVPAIGDNSTAATRKTAVNFAVAVGA